MFIFKAPIRLDKPEPLDPVQAELERRILFAPPGHLGPFPTYEEVRAELARLDGRRALSARALMLSEAGFGPPVRVVVVRDVDGGIDRIEPFGKALQPPPESAEAEQFGSLGEPDFDAENASCGRKDTTGFMLPDSVATDVEIVEVFETETSPSAADVHETLTYIGKGETSPKLQRPRRQSNSHPVSLSKTGLKPKTKLKADCKAKATAWAKARTKAAAKAKADRKPKRERKKTISPDERAEAELCFFMAEALGCPFNMKADLNPGLDHLDVEGRIEFCLKIVKNLRAYIRGRRIARGMPQPWWPDVWGWVRESNPWTNLDEHVHLVFYAPEDERRRMVDLMEDKRKATGPKVKRWCKNAKFALIDSFEHWNGAKFESALGYFVKIANPQDYHPDPTIGYKKGGFITGPRIKFSPFLTDPDRVEAHRIDVQALQRVRDENRVVMRRNGSKPARDPGSLLRAAVAPTPAPADAVPVEVLATAVPAPVLAVVAPEPIEPAIYSGSGSPGRVHHEAERRDMDLVEIGTRPAAIASTPALREPEIEAPAMAEAHADAVHPTADVTPATPPPAQAVFVTKLAAAIPPTTATADPIALAMPALSSATSASSSPNAVFAALAGVGRSVARGAAAGVGWVASRLGARPPLSPTSAARRPRAPAFDRSGFIAAGAFLGAPDVQSAPW